MADVGARGAGGRHRRQRTAGATRGSNGDGMTAVGIQRVSRQVGQRVAAASFMSSVICRARASKAPRKMPGNASTLLIWFG